MKRSLIAALALLLPACNNTSPDSTTSSTSTSTTSTSTTAFSSTYTTLTFTSTVTESPVAGANVVVAGVSYVTDSNGSITLSATQSSGATVDASASGFLTRTTLLGSSGTISLWEIPAGVDSNFIRQIAYNRGGTPEVLWRPAAGALLLRIPGDLGNDIEVRAAHIKAAAMANAMAGGKMTVALGDATTGALTATSVLNTSNTAAATTFLTQTRGTITSARIEYASLAAARDPRVIAHELGHVLGFGHAPSGIMCPTCGASDFTGVEQSIFFSMLKRAVGTQPLDNDRSLGALGGESTLAIRCDLR